MVSGMNTDEDLVVFCGTLVESVPDDVLRVPGAFGPAQSAPDGSTATIRLMAYLGRSVGTGRQGVW